MRNIENNILNEYMKKFILICFSSFRNHPLDRGRAAENSKFWTRNY